MFKTSLALSLSLMCATVHAFSPSCLIWYKCIESQGASIPSGRAIEMIQRCGEFTKDELGKEILQMTFQEVTLSSQGNIEHPIFRAYSAFMELYASPLAFDRKSNVEDISYEQIAKSCQQLTSDFESRLQ